MKLRWFVLSIFAVGLGTACLPTAKAHSALAGPSVSEYGQERDQWDAPPAEFRDIQRQGFHDGIEGAHKDFDNHRKPNVNNRDEYRHPHVPHDQREDYREGFRRGYERAMSHLMGGR